MEQGLNLKELEAFLNERKALKDHKPQNNNRNLLFWNPPQSAKIIARARFLPYLDQAIPGKIIHRHRNLPGQFPKIACLRKYGMSCPLCDIVEKYRSVTESVWKWEKIEQAICHVLPLEPLRDGDNVYDPKKAHFFVASAYQLEWLVEQMYNPQTGDITDPRTGSAVVFKRKADGKAFERSVERLPSPIGATEAEILEILATRQDADKVWKTPTDQDAINAQLAAKEIERMLSSLPSKMNAMKQPEVTQYPNAVPPKEEPKANITGRPNCFGSQAEYDPHADKCVVCRFDIECGQLCLKK